MIALLSYGQLINKPSSDSWTEKSANIDYSKPVGWEVLDSTFNVRALTHEFLYNCAARWGFYNPKRDVYMILGTRGIRSFSRHQSDSSANHYYLTFEYRSYRGLIPLKEDLVSEAMLETANVDDVVSYEIRLDETFLGKYRYAKQFLLHKEDVADVTLNFLARDKEKEEEINEAFKSIWGIIRFLPDSVYNPPFKMGLVGKFRHLRPWLNTGDSLKNARNRSKMYYRIAMATGRSAIDDGKYTEAQLQFTKAHHLLPHRVQPIIKLVKVFFQLGQLDSATVYLEKLKNSYLPESLSSMDYRPYGEVLMFEKEGTYAKAIAENKSLLQVRGWDVLRIHLSIAEEYKALENYSSSITHYKEVQQHYKRIHLKRSAYCDYRIGQCYMELSNNVKAKEYFIEAQEEGYTIPDNIKEEFNL